MNVIEYTIDRMKAEIKRLEHDYKMSLKDPSNRTVYPYSEDGISSTLDVIIHRAFELKVCNQCDRFYDCDHILLCTESINGSAWEAKEYWNRCHNAIVREFGD